MYFAGYAAQKNEELVEEAGLSVARARLETIQEKGGDATFLWVVARKPD
jgi:hypothetical protein